MPASPGLTVAPSPKVGRLARLKLTEPVRLYTYAGLALWLALAIVVAVADRNVTLALVIGGLALSDLVGIECARVSVYSPRATVEAVLRARQ